MSILVTTWHDVVIPTFQPVSRVPRCRFSHFLRGMFSRSHWKHLCGEGRGLRGDFLRCLFSISVPTLDLATWMYQNPALSRSKSKDLSHSRSIWWCIGKSQAEIPVSLLRFISEQCYEFLPEPIFSLVLSLRPILSTSNFRPFISLVWYRQLSV